ncbi:MAG TPA: hypothetical protein VGE96_07155 [Steroidobacteraceae bacterium]|jgi:ElaB/YqjD/DUF883 family membrane-anchored ribosome-binding protein
MNESNPVGGRNGEGDVRSGTDQVKEHLRAARDAAADTLRTTTEQARGWSRDRLQQLQERVEAEPYRATAWALGIGFVMGVVLTVLARPSRR